jgi:hypothetical protein
MHPALAQERGLALLATAAHARAGREARSHTAEAAADAQARHGDAATAPRLAAEDAVAIRLARPADAPALARLAVLDGQAEVADRLSRLACEPWEGSVLVAEAGGAVAAALAVEDGVAVADPFRRTALLVDLLRLRAEQLTGRHGILARRPRVAAVLRPRLH